MNLASVRSVESLGSSHEVIRASGKGWECICEERGEEAHAQAFSKMHVDQV
jgi:hypothetical protein